MKTHLLILVSLLIIFSTVSPAHAGEDGPVVSSFSLNVPPAVTGVTIYEDEALTIVPVSLTPTQTYWIKVSATDNDGLHDLESVKAVLAVGSFEADLEELHRTGFSAKSYSEQTWLAETNSITNAWEGSTWSGGVSSAHPLPTAAQLAANSSSYSYEFVFRVTIGKVAQETSSVYERWHIAALATDSAGNHGLANFSKDGVFGLPMNWYGEIQVPADSYIDWGEVQAGMQFTDTRAEAQALLNITEGTIKTPITYYCNGGYKTGVKSPASWLTWENANNSRLTLRNTHANASDTFSVKAAGTRVDNPYTSPYAFSLPEDGTSALIATTPLSTDDTGLVTVSPLLYLSLSSTITDPGTYTGVINLVIAND